MSGALFASAMPLAVVGTMCGNCAIWRVWRRTREGAGPDLTTSTRPLTRRSSIKLMDLMRHFSRTQSSSLLTAKEPDEGPALTRSKAPPSPDAITLPTSAEYHS